MTEYDQGVIIMSLILLAIAGPAIIPLLVINYFIFKPKGEH